MLNVMNQIKNANMAVPQITKTDLHPRSKHRGRYDFTRLVEASSGLAPFVQINAYGDASIDFASSQAVKALNQALLSTTALMSGIFQQSFVRLFQVALIICII